MAKTSVNKFIRDSIENVQTNQITISEDKLRIKLEKQIKRIKKSSGVLGYMSVTITCVGVLVSTDFKTVISITPDMWKTVFFIAAVVFLVLTAISGFNAIFNRVNVDSIVKDIKTSDIIAQKPDLWARVSDAFKSNKNDLAEEEEVER